MKLSRTQKIIKFFTSKALFEKMMEDSKRYRFTCSNCGKESSIWEIGGIRYKGTAKTKTGAWCLQCKKFGLQDIYKVEQ
ncbi:MAG: hypothetical protein JNM14_03245 [Ferruginibacter sp.]|nr:hypothetical protein [Ferruginibacter sp.]